MQRATQGICAVTVPSMYTSHQNNCRRMTMATMNVNLEQRTYIVSSGACTFSDSTFSRAWNNSANELFDLFSQTIDDEMFYTRISVY